VPGGGAGPSEFEARRQDVKLTLIERSKWQGETTFHLAPSGTLDKAEAGGVRLDGVNVGTEVGEMTVVRAADGSGRTVVVVSLGETKDLGPDTVRRVGGAIARWVGKREVTRAGVETTTLPQAANHDALGALAEGLLLGAFRFEEHKSAPKNPPECEAALLVNRAGKSAAAQVDRAVKLCEGVNRARRIAHQPPNVINPVSLAATAVKLAAECGLKCTVLDEKQMKKLKMGGVLAVGQGSDSPPRMIVLEYAGRKAGPPVALVGKAITFDTGGYSIKPKDGILGMKYDKCGGTAVLGTMQAVAALQPKVPVVAVIASAENMISGGAYRPDDIITTMSGKTVEIVSADAEGRMVLCDALTYAQQEFKPRAVIDLATLTGGVIIALGKLRAGLFCNHDGLRDALVESGRRTQELLWPLPMDDEYLELLKGTDSDLKNSSSRDAHAIQGAIFLKQFVDAKTAWAHLDIAGVADTDKDQAYCPKGATGFGVRLLADYLERVRG